VDTFDDFMVVATPLKIGQFHLFRGDFVQNSVIHNQPASTAFYKWLNFAPQRFSE